MLESQFLSIKNRIAKVSIKNHRYQKIRLESHSSHPKENRIAKVSIKGQYHKKAQDRITEFPSIKKSKIAQLTISPVPP